MRSDMPADFLRQVGPTPQTCHNERDAYISARALLRAGSFHEFFLYNLIDFSLCYGL